MTAVELWLPIGAIGFYLYDSMQLLWQNELLLIRAGKRWRLQAESSLRISARRVVLPHPLLPHRPQFRAAWSVADERASTHPDLAGLLCALKPIGILCQLLLWLLLLLAPVCWILGAGVVVLAQFTLYYLLVVAALVLVFRRRGPLALSTRAFWSLAFDVLACGPFAVNLLRKLSLRRDPGDPVAFAVREFDAGTRAELAQLISRRLEEEAAGESPAPQRQQQIAQWLATLRD
ncbi:MAG TPA: hypothetical protein VN645_09795 [Steroidobacteraceae bacterium]|nr:hypothetical protein [Steroidobacteraceae bacterium]